MPGAKLSAMRYEGHVESALTLICSREQGPIMIPAAGSGAMASHTCTHNAARTSTLDVEDAHPREPKGIVEACELEQAIRNSRGEYERECEKTRSAIVESIFSKNLEDGGLQPHAFSEHATLVTTR